MAKPVGAEQSQPEVMTASGTYPAVSGLEVRLYATRTQTHAKCATQPRFALAPTWGGRFYFIHLAAQPLFREGPLGARSRSSAYRERSNPPLFHRLVNLWLRAKKTRPVLRTPTKLICDSTEILQYVDRFLTEEFRLYPANRELRQQVCDFEQHLGKQVGFSVIRWAYFHFLPETDLIVPLMIGPAKSLENRLFRLLFPLIRVVMQKGLNLVPATAERAQSKIEQAMDEVASMLSDGRPYLFGDRFTAADLTCAALFGPIFVTPEYGGTRADTEKLPPAVRERRDAWLKHPTGQYVFRIYREHRHPK